MSLDYVSGFGTPIKPKEEVLMKQVIDGPQAEQLGSLSCGQVLQDRAKGRSTEELHPAWVKDKPHILILEIKETSPTAHAQNGSLQVKNGGSTIP